MMREQVRAGGLEFARGGVGSATGPREAAEPAHAHAAGPSPWPIWLAASSLVAFVGLTLTDPALLIGGLLLIAALAIGWGIDASSEWQAAETGATSRPHRVTGWGRAFAGLFIAVVGASTLASLVMSTPPPRSTTGGGDSGTAEVLAGKVSVRAVGIAFSVREILASPNASFAIEFTNDDAVPHNITIFTPTRDETIFVGALVTGPGATVTYEIPALTPGSYPFQCDVHPTTMTGAVTVR